MNQIRSSCLVSQLSYNVYFLLHLGAHLIEVSKFSILIGFMLYYCTFLYLNHGFKYRSRTIYRSAKNRDESADILVLADISSKI